MKVIEIISPEEMKATKKAIEKLVNTYGEGSYEEIGCCRYYASEDEFPKDKFWIFGVIEQFQYNPKVRGQNQIWKIDTDFGAETMFFRCIVNGKCVATRLVEWATFPIKRLELHVNDGVIRLTKKS